MIRSIGAPLMMVFFPIHHGVKSRTWQQGRPTSSCHQSVPLFHFENAALQRFLLWRRTFSLSLFRNGTQHVTPLSDCVISCCILIGCFVDVMQQQSHCQKFVLNFWLHLNFAVGVTIKDHRFGVTTKDFNHDSVTTANLMSHTAHNCSVKGVYLALPWCDWRLESSALTLKYTPHTCSASLELSENLIL